MGIKISEAMVEAGVSALIKCAEDHAISNGQPIPDFDGMSEETKAEGRAIVRAVLKAGADHFAAHGNT